jgi:hypothetical protein
MKLIFSLVCLLGTLGFAQAPPPPVAFNTFLQETAYPSVYTLYIQQGDGGKKMVCTTTAFESKPIAKKMNRIRFLTAGHCVNKRKDPLQILFGGGNSSVKHTYFIAQDDESREKTYFRVELVGSGGLEDGEDFAVFEAETLKTITTIPLGLDPPDSIDQPVINIANPMGLGTQVFRGNISRVFYDRHEGPSGSDWHGNMLIQVFGVNGGSSGSAVLCEKQRAICGIVVGTIGQTTAVAVPISRFKSWYVDLSMPKFPGLRFVFPGFDPMFSPPSSPLKSDPSQPSKRKSQGPKQ